jgi:hypothetical protein
VGHKNYHWRNWRVVSDILSFTGVDRSCFQNSEIITMGNCVLYRGGWGCYFINYISIIILVLIALELANLGKGRLEHQLQTQHSDGIANNIEIFRILCCSRSRIRNIALNDKICMTKPPITNDFVQQPVYIIFPL